MKYHIISNKQIYMQQIILQFILLSKALIALLGWFLKGQMKPFLSSCKSKISTLLQHNF